MKIKPERFFLDQDQSSHWYLVPVKRRAEWNAWCDLDEDDERSWTPPEWAVRLGGGPQAVTFENWTYR